jgi:hypothetical protein
MTAAPRGISRRRARTVSAVGLAIAMTIAACGDDDDGAAAASSLPG